MRSSARLFSSLPEKAHVPALSKYLFEILSTIEKIDGDLDVHTQNKLNNLSLTVSAIMEDSLVDVDLPAKVTLDNKHFDNTDIQYHHWSARFIAKSMQTLLEENEFEPKELHSKLSLISQSIVVKKATTEQRHMPDYAF
jgi:hypothetical protein